MEQIQTLEDALKSELKDLYSAETQIIKALPKMIKHVSSQSLKQAFSAHLQETQEQVIRLEKAAKILDFKIGGKTCKAMKGLLAEGEEIIKEMSGTPHLIDALMIGAAQRVEHYEMAGYGTARAMAESLDFTEVAELLQVTLDEEGSADKKLTEIAEEQILVECCAGQDEVDEEIDQPRQKKSGRSEHSSHGNR